MLRSAFHWLISLVQEPEHCNTSETTSLNTTSCEVGSPSPAVTVPPSLPASSAKSSTTRMASFAAPCNGNIILATDSYKVSHHRQYPPNTEKVYSYFESRGGRFPETVFFGLQYLLKQWLDGVVVTEDHIAEAKELYDQHLGPGVFYEEGWRHIVTEHGGRLPLLIRAVPEGTVVNYKNVLFTVENTDPACYWLTGYVETLLVQVWYPLTVATISREQKKIIASYLDSTADNSLGLPFKLHDFGFRGVSSTESAAIGGAAHLVNFSGTDTVAALSTIARFYDMPCAGHSIPAAEHSTITSWTQSGEADAFKNMLTQFPTGLVAVVSDSYNIWEACRSLWGDKLKELVESRGENGTLVVRPDSGSPPEVVVKCLELLGHAFGVTINEKGFKVLPPYIRLIQGDGIDLFMLKKILQHMHKFEWSADNVAFGSGGALLQRLDRDTNKCAFKCSFAVVDGKEREVFKKPITAPDKHSKKGRLTLEQRDGGWVTVQEGQGKPEDDHLVTVFKNGEVLSTSNFEEVRGRAALGQNLPAVEPMVECSNPDQDGRPCALCNQDEWDDWKREWLPSKRGRK